MPTAGPSGRGWRRVVSNGMHRAGAFKPGLAVLMFLLALPTQLAVATPYWAKPGVYVEYAAMRYDPYIQYQLSQGYSTEQRTAFLVYLSHNASYKIYAYNDTYLKFTILEETDGYLTVGVRIDMSNVTVKVTVPAGENLSPIWEQNEVIKVETIPTPGNFGTREYKVYLRSLGIEGVYRIRESDGTVFSLNGTRYGHTFLWIDTDPGLVPQENETFVVFPTLNWTMKVEKVSVRDKPKKTYYGEFGPPTAMLSLLGSPLVMEGLVEFTTQTPGDLCYDPTTGVVLSLTTISILISPDLAAIGIPFASFMDERVAYDQMVEKDLSWAGLLPLYNTNAEFQKVQKIPFSRVQTPLRYTFWVSLVLLGSIVAVRGWGRIK
ncbi:hypothetical protein TEU_10495 [Thermococcus eurythermalis]|uniref:Uncharacterized protein n=1 Tax=Thermococcus eurythermalis TaxID=1505907 RepID=A0A097QW58_9EURY|nr:hypothetical protein [Thermococcus eurythermalis]AIU70727.1 hypothetical protein TEU_10495 [Thermococcus eurythermalis]